MNYPKNPGFDLYHSRHYAYLTYSVKTWFLKSLSVFKNILKNTFEYNFECT